MNNTIKELYRGEILPEEECNTLSSEADGIEEHAEKLLMRLKKSLSKEQAELLSDYIDACDELIEAKKERCFTVGFRLGARLSTECYSE